MSDPRIARIWFLVTALAVLVAVVIQIPDTAAVQDGFFSTPLFRVLNLFTYFTILSNLIVAASSLLLAVRLERTSTAFRALRLTGVVAITVTGIVYHLLLAGLVELTPVGQVSNFLTHTAVPVLGVAGWLLFGPRGGTSWRIVLLTLVYPVAWLVMALVRGVVTGGFYPYPFLDVGELGAGPVALVCLGMAAFYLGLAALAHVLDRFLGGRTVYRGLSQD